MSQLGDLNNNKPECMGCPKYAISKRHFDSNHLVHKMLHTLAGLTIRYDKFIGQYNVTITEHGLGLWQDGDTL